MATLTNVTKNSGSLTGLARSIGDAEVFYGWMFFFTVPKFTHALTNVAKTNATITNVAKS